MLHTLLQMMSMLQKYVKLYSCVSISPVEPGNVEEMTGEGKGLLLLMNTSRLCSMLRQD